ncbi:MAG: hypothetical protein V3V41_04050 [Candidatus Heimdallarchaeota archaeon]
MRNLFESINIRATIVGIFVTEVLLIAILLAFDLSNGMTIVGYTVWSLVFIISFPFLLRQWNKEVNGKNELQ